MADHREDFVAHEHVEPVHYEKFGFCRQPCEECDRLDHEEREDGMPSAEALARGVAMAFEAAEAQRRASR
jgi:hypothetical protein